jgi:hypothetical protein
VTFPCEHLGNPVPSLAPFNTIGTAFRHAVSVFADEHGIPPWSASLRATNRQGRGDKARPAASDAMWPRVVAISVGQEFHSVLPHHDRSAGQPS